MATPHQDEWIQKVLKVAIDRGQAIAHAVADASPFGGEPGQGQATSAKASPHVTVIQTPIIVHGKDPSPVVEVKKPIKVVIDDKARQQSRDIDQSEIDIALSAKQKVTTLHGDMHDRVGTWFRNEDTIDSMSDGPGDLFTGLASAFAGGITGVIGAAFPEVAEAMAALAAVEAGVQTAVTTAKKDAAGNLKAQAKKFMHDIADEAEKLIYEGRNEALKAIQPLVDALENDPSDFQLLASHSDENIERLATRVASRWGTLADPGILDKLEAKLHLVLQLRIKGAAKARKRETLQAKVRNRYSPMTESDAKAELEAWEAEYDRENGIPLPEAHQIDTTRPD
jgi:hypothetical protein